MKAPIFALLFVAASSAGAAVIPTVDMVEVCALHRQGDPRAIATYEWLKKEGGLDPVKACAQLEASGELDKPRPEDTARSFMAQIANVNPAQVEVVTDTVSNGEAIATARAPGGKRCTFSMSEAPAGAGWMVGALECKQSSGGGFPVTDYNAIERLKKEAQQ